MKIREALAKEKYGLVYGNKVLLPFKMYLLGIWIGYDMSFLSSPDKYVDFLPNSRHIGYGEHEAFTEIVFREYHDLSKEFGKHKGHVTLFCCEKGSDPFTPADRLYVRLHFRDDSNIVKLEISDEEIDF